MTRKPRGHAPSPKHRRVDGPRRTVTVLLALAVLVVLGGLAAVLALVLGDGEGTGADATADSPTSTGPAASPSGPAESARPSPTGPLSRAPLTIPAVREHTPARGPGWRPAADRRVVVADAVLADEGRLIADELGLGFAGDAAAGPGDVELVLDGDGDGGSEAYVLTVRDDRVRIAGATERGVFHGTRTLKQAVRGAGAAPEGVVRDEPAKPRRGFMLDIARKTYSVDWIEDRIRELGDLKFNELGLHFSDDQGFRIASDRHPEVVSRDHLTKAEVRRILALARSRHIDVVPEIDSPGHLGAVIAAHPDLQLRGTDGSGPRGAVDISRPGAGEIVDELLREYAELFPGPYWHLGGDEYPALFARDPAAHYPQLAAAARERYGAGATVRDLATGWVEDRAETVRDLGRRPRAWNDGFFRGGVQPAEDIETAYWTGTEIGAREPVEYLRTGRPLVNYNDEYLYYVLGEPNQFTYPTGRRIYEEWTPLVVRGTRPVDRRYDRQILGGSFAVWGDFPNAQTPAQVAAGIRLPLRATAQKLWDPARPALAWDEFVRLADRVD
ncbi:glycoside hydrolase family 20 protein [Streptomyces sp. NPDC002490]|uniref:beta-N-acetylhexosaminidase n=1 Tax=Streptomyces sp. NPDC002490 TaxID=3154416 RepID=UPI003323E7BC